MVGLSKKTRKSAAFIKMKILSLWIVYVNEITTARRSIWINGLNMFLLFHLSKQSLSQTAANVVA
jgi:hypothetical protein